MTVVLISGNSYCRYAEIAQKVAQNLEFPCISQEVFLTAAQEYNVTQEKLIKAFDSGQSLIGMSSQMKERLLIYFKAVLLKLLSKDNLVYYGQFGHLFVKGAAHIYKVNIDADFNDRVHFKMNQDKISQKKARKAVLTEDKRLQKWLSTTFQIDSVNNSLFDTVISVSGEDLESAVQSITTQARDPKYSSTTYSKKYMQDRVLSSLVTAASINTEPNLKVTVSNGKVYVDTLAANKNEKEKKEKMLREQILKIEGVKNVYVTAHIDTFQSMESISSSRL